MVSIVAILESIKRHWVPIAVVTAVFLGVGVASSFVKDGSVEVAPTYTAETAIYINGYKESADLRFNYDLDENLLVSDARRVVLSNEVAGEVRRQMGEDVVVSSPRWINPKNNADYPVRFIFVHATAPSADIALKAADLAAEKATAIMKDTLPVEKVEIQGNAVLTETEGKATDFGSDELMVNADAPVKELATKINPKNVLVYTFVGLFVTVFIFALIDILTRRVRSYNDAERRFGASVLARVDTLDSDFSRAAAIVTILAEKSGYHSLAVVGATAEDAAAHVADNIVGHFGDVNVSSCSVSDESDSVRILSTVDAVLFVSVAGASKGRDIDETLRVVQLFGVPVVGTIFIESKKK